MLVAALAVAASRLTQTAADECKLTPVVHVLQYPGCVPKPIPSYACVGHCTSYVQVRSRSMDRVRGRGHTGSSVLQLFLVRVVCAGQWAMPDQL